MKYTLEKAQECVEWVEQHGLIDNYGATLDEFLAAMSISKQTYYNWCKKLTFLTAIKKAHQHWRHKAPLEIYNKLLHKARGYDRQLTKTKTYYSVKLGETITETITETHHYPPDTGAAIFLLTNLDPENFKNRNTQETNLKIKEGSKIVVEDASDAKKLEQALKQSDEI